MKRYSKIGLLLVLTVLLIAIGYQAYEYRDTLVPYLSDPAKIFERYTEAPKEEVPPRKEITPPQEVAPTQKGRVVFLGDSITYRWDNMPAEIAGYQAVNRGIDGNSTANMVLRFNHDVIELEPERVFILGGINDLLFAFQYDLITVDLHLEKTAGNIQLMTDLAKKAGIEPILCSVLPVSSNFRLPPDAVNQVVEKLNASIVEIADQEEVTYLDLWPVLVDADTQMLEDDYASPDGIHLSPRGYDELLQAVSEVLK